jgi:outer membrane protein OmpA-like peptidoglycan-associated protein
MKKVILTLTILALLFPSLAMDNCLGQSVGGGIRAKPTLTPEEDEKFLPKRIIVEKLKKEGEVVFQSGIINFDYGSAMVRPESMRQISELAMALRDERLAGIPQFFVDGHTCDIGSDENNCNLALRRALSIIQALVEKEGIALNKLVPRSFGERSPLHPNETETQREKNRRVVLKKAGPETPQERGLICQH